MTKLNIAYYEPKTSISGLSYGRWTVLWWRWALSIPRIKNPLLDDTGRNANPSQTNSVSFLAGIYADEFRNEDFPTRQCALSKDTSILIPVLNCEADSIEYPEIRTDQDILEHVASQVDNVVIRKCSVDGVAVPPVRVPSDPVIFDLYVHPDFDRRQIGGHTRASSDGYWVFLQPLENGRHVISFEGSYKRGLLKSGARYIITIV
jgi:hypothetical protein